MTTSAAPRGSVEFGKVEDRGMAAIPSLETSITERVDHHERLRLVHDAGSARSSWYETPYGRLVAQSRRPRNGETPGEAVRRVLAELQPRR